MGIYIKDMRMPTDDMKNIMILADGRVFQFSGYGNPKPLGTAVPVPTPHGRLIDADELEKEAQKRMLICSKNGNQFQKPYEIMRAIALAPTIIPAEQKGE